MASLSKTELGWLAGMTGWVRAFGEGAGGVAVEDLLDDAEFGQCGRLGIVQEFAHGFQCIVEQFVEVQQVQREPAGDLLGVLRSRVAVRREYGVGLSLCEPRDARDLAGVESKCTCPHDGAQEGHGRLLCRCQVVVHPISP